MRVTERDLDILRWVNSVGFANIEHIVSRYKISKPTAYARLKKLTDKELLAHEYHLHSHPGHYRVTRDGKKLSDDHLPPLSKVKLGSYKHDQLVTTLSILLTNQYDAKFITERQIRYQQSRDIFNQRRPEHHYCDGILMIGDKKIAIEVELTTKGQARLKKIYSHYMFASDLDEVWYFCGNNEVENLIQKVMGMGGNIKTFLLDDVML